MRIHHVHVSLPTDWEEVPNESRSYRRKGVNGGTLTISLRPPVANAIDENAVVDALGDMLNGVGLDVGQEVTSAHGPSPMGIIATSLYKSQRHGLLQFWLVAAEVTVFASYIMGDLSEAKKDLLEAHQIVKTLQLVHEE